MINRRKFLEKSIKTGLGGCLAFPFKEAFLEDRALKIPGPPQARGHRPDIIFLMTDQQRWDALGSLNSHIRTPHLDRLAKKGVIFRNATCQSPSCVPSRNSMMFGLYPSQLGILSNGSHSLGDSFLPCDPLPARLQKVGYQTAGFGKTHWGRTDEQKSTRGFEIRVVGAKEVGLEIEGPEFETIYALGGLNEVDSLEEIAYLNYLCDLWGLDTMSAGNISAFAIEASRRGKLDFRIDYNQPDRIADLFRLIAQNEGPGSLLGKGIKAAAAELDLEELAIHVKGLEPGGFDPRVLKGMGLAYATAARGACHLRGTFYKAELSGQIDKDQIAGKAELMIDYEDRAALFDSLILCRFFRDFISWQELSLIIEAATGLSYDKTDLENLANHHPTDAGIQRERGSGQLG
jgi:hypothetical protein